MAESKTKGGRALLGAALAIIGALAAVNPANVLLATLSEVVPKLAEALPPGVRCAAGGAQ